MRRRPHPSELRYNPDAIASKGLIRWIPIAGSTVERYEELIQGAGTARAGSAPASTNYVSEDILPDGTWMPYFNIVNTNNAYHDMGFNPSQLLGSNPFTLIHWWRPTLTGEDMILYAGTANPNRFYISQATAPALFIGMGDSFDSSMSSFTDNKWQMFSLTFDGTNWRTTVDGLAGSNAGFTGSKSLTNATTYWTDGSGSSGNYNGKIGPFSLHNYAMTDQQIWQIRQDYWGAFLGPPQGHLTKRFYSFMVVPRR